MSHYKMNFVYNIASWYCVCTHEEHETYIEYVLNVQEIHSERLFVNKRIQCRIIINISSKVEVTVVQVH